MKKIFRVKIIVNGADEPFSPDLEAGVLGFRDVVYDLTEKEYESPVFLKSLMEERDKLLSELIKTEVQIIEE